MGSRISSLIPMISECLDWRRALIGRFVDAIFGGGTPATSKPEYWDGSIRWTTSAIISKDDIDLRVFSEDHLPNRSGKLSAKSHEKVVSLLGTRDCELVKQLLRHSMWALVRITALVPNQNVLPDFLAFFLSTRYSQWIEGN